jgi:antitoxin ParD1/3/4
MTDDVPDSWPTAAEKAEAIAQARALKQQARKGGLRFEVYLPPGLAEWLLEPHADLRRELLTRTVQAAIDDPRPSIPAQEVMERLKKIPAEPRPEPAVWRRAS